MQAAEAKPPPPCDGSRAGLVFYRDAYTASRQLMRLPGAPKLVRYDCAATRRRAADWRRRARLERRAARAWVAYHFHWWVWMPAKWQRIGACETGYGRRPGNWRHANGGYVSMFGISRRAYDEDARYMGAPPWNDERPPTPRQQLMAAVGHYRLHNGFSGWGCRGA